ncbi:uncharacterized protein [Miscanthus floridulus]|uniref:uncharacterized protein n=1 Tax=Miscanthus floridulus TaxID=154761 RepID=UPI00345B2DFE
MGRPRPKRGERRIDAAIDHLAQYGFAKPQIRKIINNLLQLYGRDGWVFLEEGSYRVVLDKLLEEQTQEDQKQEAAAAEEAPPPQNGMEVARVHGEALDESRSALELQASPNSSPPLECVLPLAPARPPRARPPCYGWISEESGTESEPEDGEMLSVETLPSKRKRPSRWDVHPN